MWGPYLHTDQPRLMGTLRAPDRPLIPQAYGISPAPEGLLSWEVVDQALSGCDLYWVATVNPAGGPHLIPIHAAYTDRRIYISGDPATRWCRNLEARPQVEIGAASQSLQIMFGGKAQLITPDEATFASISANIASKYDWEPTRAPTWKITPASVIALDVADFANSPTRFRFEEEP